MLFKYNNSLNKHTPFDWPLGHITDKNDMVLRKKLAEDRLGQFIKGLPSMANSWLRDYRRC